MQMHLLSTESSLATLVLAFFSESILFVIISMLLGNDHPRFCIPYVYLVSTDTVTCCHCRHADVSLVDFNEESG